MNELNPERNRENLPPFNHKTVLNFKFETGDFFQTDNQPTVGTRALSRSNKLIRVVCHDRNNISMMNRPHDNLHLS